VTKKTYMDAITWF